MARFAESLAELLATEGINVPEGFGESLTSAYDEDISAALAESNTVIAARDEMIRNLKAAQAIERIPEEAKDTYADPDEEVDADFDDFFGDVGDDDDPTRK